MIPRDAMLERTITDTSLADAPPKNLAGRRALYFTLVGLLIAGSVGLLAYALAPGGFGLVDLILCVLFAITLPWIVIGFLNAVIGLLIMRFTRDPVAADNPASPGGSMRKSPFCHQA